MCRERIINRWSPLCLDNTNKSGTFKRSQMLAPRDRIIVNCREEHRKNLAEHKGK